MLITDSFVMLNMPKTGSSFVRSAIKDIYARRRKKAPATYKILKKIQPLASFADPKVDQHLFLKELKLTTSNQLPKNQHGFYSQIPHQYRDREVASAIRNPYDRFLSTYTYRWWARYPRIDQNTILKHLPNYPDLSMDEYVDLLNLFNTAATDYTSGARSRKVGPQTTVFVRMFSKEPEYSFKQIDSNASLDDIVSNLAKITFLRQEKLTEELASFLESHGFSKEETGSVKRKKKVNTSRKSDDDVKRLWTPKSLAYVREREALLFQILEELGISYSSSEYEQAISASS